MKKLISRSFWAGLFVMTALTAGCSANFNQDPLANQPGLNPQPPGRDERKPNKPIPSEALRIDSDQYFSFKEATPSEPRTITGHLLIPAGEEEAQVGVDFNLSIANLDEFPGATFDQMTGKFAWTPPIGTVDRATTREMFLEVEMTTTGSTKLFTNKKIAIYITRAENDPEIVSVDGLTGRIREGESRDFTVSVKDPDAVDRDGGRPRVLVVASANGKNNAAQMVSMVTSSSQPNPTKDPADASKWIFRMRLETTDQEITVSQATLSFGVIAISRHGKMSAPKTTDVQFITGLTPPRMSWKEVIEIPSGQPAVVNFTVFDPKFEGRMTATFTRCAGPGAVCKCVPQSTWNSSSVICTVTWTPPTISWPSSGTFYVELTAVNSSPVSSDPQNQTQKLSGTIRVVSPQTGPQWSNEGGL